MKCLDKVRKTKRPCKEKNCRQWIDHSGDLNCVLEAVDNSDGPMTLRECADRLGISFVRVRQIEKKALEKLKMRTLNDLND